MSTGIPVSDQWKLEGNCSICRRKNYCQRRCTANHRRTNAMISGHVIKAMGPVFSVLDFYQKS